MRVRSPERSGIMTDMIMTKLDVDNPVSAETSKTYDPADFALTLDL